MIYSCLDLSAHQPVARENPVARVNDLTIYSCLNSSCWTAMLVPGKTQVAEVTTYSCPDWPCLSANLASGKTNAPSFVGTIYSCLDDPPNCRHNQHVSGFVGEGVVGERGEVKRRGHEEGRNYVRGDCNKHIPIYNYVSGPNTLTFQENTDVILERLLEVPSTQAIWYPWGIPFRSVFWYRVFAIFVHVIPGALLDIALVIKGNPPMFLKIYRKIDKYMLSMKYFTTFNWNFYNRKCMSLYQSLAQEEKEIFYFDSNAYDWRDYLRSCIYGLRIYLFKESPDTIPAGKSRLIKYKTEKIIINVLIEIFLFVTACSVDVWARVLYCPSNHQGSLIGINRMGHLAFHM
uniref:Fatty acyl-CoA reductase C-terminal domain-containing protein n=1 Tax=Timema poppense TaxID=170557 RepID=A0A7R9GWT9_TIMPO|nr:unnamed protein product [Timema poppensis]